MPFHEITQQLNLKEKSLNEFMSNENKHFVESFKETLPMMLIFELYLEDKKWKKKWTTQFLHYFSYSILLLVSYYFLFLVYQLNIKPILIEQFTFFKVETIPKKITYLTLFHRFNFLLLVILLALSLIFYIFKDLRMSFYTYIHNRIPNNMLSIAVNHHFVTLWSVLAKNHIESPMAIKILRSPCFNTHITWLAFQIESTFEEFAQLPNKHLDPLLFYMIESRPVEHKYIEIFPRYLKLSETRLQYKLIFISKLFKAWIVFLIFTIIYQYYTSFYIPLQFWEVL